VIVNYTRYIYGSQVTSLPYNSQVTSLVAPNPNAPKPPGPDLNLIVVSAVISF